VVGIAALEPKPGKSSRGSSPSIAQTTLRELAKRGNGLIDKWDREGFELALEIGRGGIWLRLSDKQYQALGGVL